MPKSFSNNINLFSSIQYYTFFLFLQYLFSDLFLVIIFIYLQMCIAPSFSIIMHLVHNITFIFHTHN